MKISKTADHEVAEVVLRTEPERGKRLILRDPTGDEAEWTVIDCKADPHGWKVTAVRCLPACRRHSDAGDRP